MTQKLQFFHFSIGNRQITHTPSLLLLLIIFNDPL